MLVLIINISFLRNLLLKKSLIIEIKSVSKSAKEKVLTAGGKFKTVVDDSKTPRKPRKRTLK